jgi:hypothetical protein
MPKAAPRTAPPINFSIDIPFLSSLLEEVAGG